MIGAGNARIERSHRSSGRVSTAGDRLVGVSAVAGGVGADDRKFVCELREFRKRATEGDAGQGRLQLAVDAARLDWRRHLRIEELDVRRSALVKEQDDRPVLDRLAGRGRTGASREQ